MAETEPEYLRPTLSDLIRVWLNIHFPTEVKIKGPDDWFVNIHYIDDAEHDIWLVDIDNREGTAVFRDTYQKKSNVVNAANPDFFALLERHIKVRLDEIGRNGRDEHR